MDKAAIRAERNSRMSHLGLGSHAKIEALLRDKINGKTKAGGSMLFRTFRKFDVNKDGVVDFEEFKNIMNKWNLNMNDTIMRELFSRYDNDGNGHIKYYDFLKHLMPSDFPMANRCSKQWLKTTVEARLYLRVHLQNKINLHTKLRLFGD